MYSAVLNKALEVFDDDDKDKMEKKHENNNKI
jgi:hypothetical protein